MLQLQGLVMNPSETGNFISPKKITRIRGSGLNFYGLRDDVMCILLVFGLQRAISKIFGGILCDREKCNTRRLALLKTTGRATTLVHPMKAISCEICQIEVDTCFCFVYILLHSDYPYHFK